jgi:hypothetical protein
VGWRLASSPGYLSGLWWFRGITSLLGGLQLSGQVDEPLDGVLVGEHLGYPKLVPILIVQLEAKLLRDVLPGFRGRRTQAPMRPENAMTLPAEFVETLRAKPGLKRALAVLLAGLVGVAVISNLFALKRCELSEGPALQGTWVVRLLAWWSLPPGNAGTFAVLKGF